MKNRSVYALLGASNHVPQERQAEDLYCTHPKATEELLKLGIDFDTHIWEPCDGLGHISDTLIANGYQVQRSDKHTRGRDIESLDFLAFEGTWDGDIITNPPYSHATEFVRKALSVVKEGRYVAMYLRILFLESLERQRLFSEFPPVKVWISSRRIPCGREGVFGASAQGYAWYVWEKGHNGDTLLGWF